MIKSYKTKKKKEKSLALIRRRYGKIIFRELSLRKWKSLLTCWNKVDAQRMDIAVPWKCTRQTITLIKNVLPYFWIFGGPLRNEASAVLAKSNIGTHRIAPAQYLRALHLFRELVFRRALPVSSYCCRDFHNGLSFVNTARPFLWSKIFEHERIFRHYKHVVTYNLYLP